MAIYHMHLSNISRAKGSSACATLSYISGEKVYDERTGETYDYGRKERILKTGTLLPVCAPLEYRDAKKLFNVAEKNEKTKNARTAKKIEVALPRELNLNQQIELIENYISSYLTFRGYCATYAIHLDPKGKNPHAHILVVNRPLNQKGEWGTKRKMEYVLDDNGQRIPVLDDNGAQKTDKNGRKQWKRVSVEQNALDTRDFLNELREGWAYETNNALLRYSPMTSRVDHCSYREQGIKDKPQIHEGYAAREMERRGKVSERCELNRQIILYNDTRRKIEAEKRKLERELKTEREIERLWSGEKKKPYKPYKLSEEEKIGLELLRLLRNLTEGKDLNDVKNNFAKNALSQVAEIGTDKAQSRIHAASKQISGGKLCLPVPREFVTKSGKLDESKIAVNPRYFTEKVKDHAAKKDGEMYGDLVATLVPIPLLKGLIKKTVAKAAEVAIKASKVNDNHVPIAPKTRAK